MSNEIKFKFDIELMDKYELDYLFNNVGEMLNIRFDENHNVYSKDTNEIYQFRDVSDESSEIAKLEEDFFNFAFDEVVNVPLYRFLVFKNNDKLTVLANIHSSIFGYTSINKIYNLFNNSNNTSFKSNVESHYNGLDDYLSSSDFMRDCDFWKEYLLDEMEYVKFYNLKSDNCKRVKIPFDNESLCVFLNENNVSKFNFFTAIFSLYLSRIDRSKGCLLKMIIPENDYFDKNTILKIDYNKTGSFNDYLVEIERSYNISCEYTKVGIENYIDEEVSYYSVFDFTDLADGTVLNGEGSALTLNVYENSLDLVYNSDLFSEIYINHMAENIESLIDAVLNNPNQQCMDIDILSSNEKDLLGEFCKGNSVDVDKDKTWAMAFRENAIKYPDFMAVDDGVNQITYGELESSTNSVAYDLANRYGVGLGDCVGLMLPRNYHFPEMALALNKIGAVFVPVDPFFPLKRIEFMLNISEASYIITTRDYAQNIPLDIDVICVEDLNMGYDVSVECVGSGDDLFGIYFTSGTTGIPKGVMLSNKQIKGASAAGKDMFNTYPGDVVGYFAGFSFIASLRMFATFIFGECCRIFNETEQKDSLLLIKSLKEQEMSDLILPPALGVPIFENEDIKLKHLILGGAKLNELKNKKSTTKVVNFYGSTEALMVILNIFDLNNCTDSVPIGRPVANTWAYILDDDGKQLPIGVPGEICVSSDFLSPGYYNRPDLSAEVFVNNPNSTCDDNKRMYRTGDIGYFNFNGEIEIIGREDDQLSVRGFRIESGEILKIMKSFKNMGDVYLDVDNDTLIAYYTLNDDLDINVVKDSLKNELPYYMVPSLFVELENIPLNHNGKLDKNALKNISQKGMDVEISDETLKVVLDAFKTVLDNDFVLVDDDFVELGGTSLSAMHLQGVIKQNLAVSLSSSEIIELSTPVNIANHIKFNLNSRKSINVKYSFDDGCPLSDSQLNVYLDELVNDMGTAYNNPLKIEFENNNYSVDEIKNALIKLFEAFPVLKARIIDVEGVPHCVFDAEADIIEGSLNDIESFVRPFDFDSNLSRFLIVDGGNSVILCCDIHHIIFDGTSFDVLFNRFYSILNNVESDFVDEGILKEISFEEDLTQDYQIEASEFFDNMLADKDEVYELLSSVTDEKSSELDVGGDNLATAYDDEFKIDKDCLNSFLRNNRITHNQFFASVFAYTLSRFTGSSKVLFNLIEDGRGHIDLTESVGMFVKTLPILIDCSNRDVKSFVEKSSKLVNSVMKYDLYPFHVLANEHDLRPDILFQYSHNLFNKVINNGGLDYNVVELEHDAQNDLSFFIFDADETKFGIKITYTDKFSKTFIEQFSNTYKLIFKEMIHVGELSEINYTTSSDLAYLDSFNATEYDLEYDDILDAFNDNLAEYPKNILVTYKNNSYTYDEGAFIANEISNKLKNMGVNKDDNVAFLVERSELYMFSILGIISMGGIYVPLDDAHPDERIGFILEDTNSKAVIVSDDTYERVIGLSEDICVLNVSDILKEDVKTLGNLPVVYGDLACILYTSGTTGVPKGVKITRKSILNYISFCVNKYGIRGSDVYALYASIGFDVGAIKSIFVPLFSGACLDIIPDEIKLDIGRLNKHFIKNNITHAHLPTQIAKLFLNDADNNALKVLVTGGEKLGKIDYSCDYILVDSYGPTEACVSVTAIKEADKMDSSSIGYLLYNLKAYVLDDELRRVPVGAVGELCIAGSQIAEGYLNREEETKKAFMENSFDRDEEYSVMYRTGDMVRVLPDGSLAIVGRRDSQVKIRGNRVELSEVESAIRTIDDIEDVTVQTVTNNGNNELIAYVVLSEGSKVENVVDYVQEYVSMHKPEFMVPSYIVKLDNIPLNANGKVDKSALPDVDRDSLHAEYVAPRNETEKEIVAAFEKVFNLEKISIYDNFIRLGGNSLTAIKLLSYIDSNNVTMADILSFRTPEAIAKNISDFSFDLDIYSLESGCPLNSAQINVFGDILSHNKVNAYHIPGFIPISKEYGLENILNSLDELLKAHPILSMHLSKDFETDDMNDISNFDALKDLIRIGKKFGIKEITNIISSFGLNLKGLYDMLGTTLKILKGDYPYLVMGPKPHVSVESVFDENIIMDFFSESFDLYDSLAMFMIMQSDESYYLFFMIHHLVFDASSSFIFKQDLQTLLDGGSIEYDDAFLKSSAFTHQIKNTDKFGEAREFYDSFLSDFHDKGGLLGDNSSKGFNISFFDLEFDKSALKSFLKNVEVSESVLFSSVFAYALSNFVEDDEILFIMLENGRDRFDENFIGMGSNLMPVLIDCKDQSITSFMENAADIIYGTIRYSYYPLMLLYQKYDFNLNFLFQFIPNWITTEFGEIEGINSLDIIKKVFNSYDDFLIDFFVQVEQEGEDYKLLFMNSNKYSDKMIKDFKDVYESILSDIINADPSANLTSTFTGNLK